MNTQDDAVPSPFQRGVNFVKRHQTLVACTATGVVSVLVTRELDAQIAKKFAYRIGYENGHLQTTQALQLGVLYKFIDSKEGMKEEVMEFIANLGNIAEDVEEVIS